ncbi:MAG: peptide chain release factor N(5)-glutamine methyltransferase [Ruminococcaceae bacterium]|nr:peptide chain release factor N(5)-glutamine methyltransferase [Oscillospiraceae bacterium]
MSAMTLRQLYDYGRRTLAALPVDAPDHEALLLCQHFLGIGGRIDITARGDSVPQKDAVAGFLAALEQRSHRPLQYILGEWEFCGMPLAVGEGVLVPREDTAALVEVVCEHISRLLEENAKGSGGQPPRPVRVLDLCAGSGAVGLAAVRAFPNVSCTFVEYSKDALPWLRRNTARWGDGRTEIVELDVLAPPPQDFPRGLDVICSNPPYIPAGDIDGLAREVRQEPRMALDGGEDGLCFYRAIARNWAPLLREGGLLAVEIGAGQECDVERIYVRELAMNPHQKTDFNGVIRAIYGTDGAKS